MVQWIGSKDVQYSLFSREEPDLDSLDKLLASARTLGVEEEMVFEFGNLRNKGFTTYDAVVKLFKDFNLP